MVTAKAQVDDSSERTRTEEATAYLRELLDDHQNTDEACRRTVRFCIERDWLKDIAHTITFAGFQRIAHETTLHRHRDVFKKNRAIADRRVVDEDEDEGVSLRSFRLLGVDGFEVPDLDTGPSSPLVASDDDAPAMDVPPADVPDPDIDYEALTYTEDITYQIGGLSVSLGQLCVDQMDWIAPKLEANIMGNARKYAMLKAVRELMVDDEGRSAADVLGRVTINRVSHDACSARSFADALRRVVRFDPRA